jgi:hypothetical protein
MSTNQPKVNRNYGIERGFGDIIYNPKTRSVFANIDLGFFGRTTLTLIKRDDGGFDLMKNYTDRDGNEQVVCIGKTFPATRRDNTIVSDMTKGTLGLLRKYDDVLKKEITDNSDALYITTHKLKESKPLGDSGLSKVGFITGQFGIEIAEVNNLGPRSMPQNEYPEEAISDEEIPF